MTATYFTRADYLNTPREDQSAAHRRYYGQFVTPAVIEHVRSVIGESCIKNSADKHLNDIPLLRWDMMEQTIKRLCLSRMGDINGHISVDAHGRRSISWSLGDAVCIAKEAARQIQEGK